MNPLGLSYSQFQILVLVFFRIAGIIFMAPVLNGQMIPMPVKVFFCFVTCGLFFNFVKDINISYMDSVPQLLISIISELSIGFIIGFVSQLIFTGITFAGELIGLQIGLSIAHVLNPLENHENSIISNFINLMAILIFLNINGHHWFFESLDLSLKILPLGLIHYPAKIMLIVLNSFNKLFIIAIKISAPIMGTILILDLVFGFLSRMVPQIEIFIMSIPLKISGGLIMLALTLGSISNILQKIISELPYTMVKIVKLLH
ncbi:MAG: flagellar biosynthetic protein FliR [Candidatus Firestonebacteria bacterium]|nr:flagellar biosynthetic protein FliR [Candidatus Firestonebacteria bacterium]